MADEPKVDDEEAEPLSTRDVELEPVSLRDIEMILAPGKAPPRLKPETLADKLKRIEAARAKDGGDASADTPTRPDTPALIKQDAKDRKAPVPPPRKADAKASAAAAEREATGAADAPLREALERAKAPLPPPQPKDSGLEDLRQLAASHPPPAKKVDAVDFDAVLRDGDAPPPPAPLPPDLTALQGGEGKAKAQPKAPLKKRDAKKEPVDVEAPPASERPPRSSPGSKRPAARSERPRTTGVPAKSVEPARPSGSVRPAKVDAATPPPSGGGRAIMIAIGGIALLGVGYFLGRGNETPTPPPTPAATVTVTVTVTAPAPPPPETAAASEPPPEPTASASAPPVATTPSTALPTALTGAQPTAVGTATTKPTAAPGGGEFDKAAASAALSGAVGQAAACKKEGDPSGKAQVSVTFAPSGKVTIANVNGPPFAGTATGGCIAKAFRSATVAPFSGDPVTVSKTVNIP